ncbi:MAG: dihydropteroate synthase [Planctomycetes bacterium]|nr:dihydropteroate synthase [Planctomycetota bacterium]
MVSLLTRYNPRVLAVSHYAPYGAEKRLRRKDAGDGTLYTISLEDLSGRDRNLLSRWASSAGGRLHAEVNGRPGSTLLSVNEDAFRRTTSGSGNAGTGLEHVLGTLEDTIRRYRRNRFSLSHGGGMLKLGQRTCVMGILNVTPDSFYDGGRYFETEKAVAHGLRLIEEGAGIIDVGGVSTRPGSQPVSREEELGRIIPVIKELAGHTKVPISVDTYRAGVAEKALEAGAQIVNDISGFIDKDMARVVASTGAPVVIMHIKGRPHRMPRNPAYKDLLAEITLFIRKKADEAVSAGVNETNIIIDPGIGFGKSPGQSLEVLRRLGELRSLGLPIMVGTSNKGFIKHVQEPLRQNGTPDAGSITHATLATVALAIEKGAKVVRVHEVREAVQVAAVADAIKRE